MTQSNRVKLKPGDTIGRYKLLERIGEGGFGSVYIAEQKEPVKRQVALKIISTAPGTNAFTKGVTDHKNWLTFTKTVYISPDGRVVVGYGLLPPSGQSPFPIPKTWIVTLR